MIFQSHVKKARTLRSLHISDHSEQEVNYLSVNIVGYHCRFPLNTFDSIVICRPTILLSRYYEYIVSILKESLNKN
jgi:hypothetical protein